MAELPSADSATDMPWRPLSAAPVLISLLPCCVQTPALRVNTHAAPAAPRPNGTDPSRALSLGPPTMAVLPSADSATDMPWRAFPAAPVPTSFSPCCIQTPPLRVNTHTASACHPPTMAVFPSADSATDIPWPSGNGGSPARYTPVPTSLLPCCVQTPPLRVNTHAAPVVLLSLGPPTTAVLPSADRATDAPWDHSPPPYSLVLPTSLSPCRLQTPPLRVNTHAAPVGPTKGDLSRSALLGPGPPPIAVSPFAESATDIPWFALPTAPMMNNLSPCRKICSCASCSNRTACRMRSTSAPTPFGSLDKSACDPISARSAQPVTARIRTTSRIRPTIRVAVRRLRVAPDGPAQN